ncbi:uncharacterized protein METZ01_LOCUS103410 [marine metagenome]|uniref:Cytochrome c domain-containing protein n=1 Tax=marine metagenome TaxID=408172 RepID=A0A381WDE5_9ZZZZ
MTGRNQLLVSSFSLIAFSLMVAFVRPVYPQDSDADLYGAACAACHGFDGSGNLPAQLGFDVEVPDFTDCDFAAREPDADWYAVIHDGGPVRGFDRMMPAFGQALTGEQIQQILDHVRTLCTDEAWPPGEFNLPRSLFVEKAYPEDEAVITTTIQGEGQDSLTHELLWEYRFGARSQIEISLPLHIAELKGTEGREKGFGDLELGLKHNLKYDKQRGTILSVGGELILPSGDDSRGFGKGTAVFEPYVAWGKILPRDSFFQLQGLLEFPTESGFDNELGLKGVFGRTWTTGGPFGRAWTPMLGVLGSKDLGSGGDTHWDLVPQLQVTLNTRQHVTGSFGFRVPASDSSARETQFVFYLLWDWFDGGALEGW